MVPDEVFDSLSDIAPRVSEVFSPMTMVVKNSDVIRAWALVGVEIIDQDSLEVASRRLVAMGMLKVKVRLCQDMSSSGVNGACERSYFSYPSIRNAINMVRRGCWLAKGDLEGYFHAFPLSKEARDLFMFEFDRWLYEMTRVAFGLRPAPYFCSTFSAEFKQWFEAMGLPVAHMVDDWLTMGCNKDEAESRRQIIKNVFVLVGLTMQDDKDEIGQTLVFCGVRIDTVNMTVSIDPVQAGGVRRMLQRFQAAWANGLECQPAGGEIRSMAGKLTWFGSLLQSGPCRTRSWWVYSAHPHSLVASVAQQLREDTEWWCSVLEMWEHGVPSMREYPILSASRLLDEEGLIRLIVSDASGPDGLGYFHGPFGADENSYQFYSAVWGSGYIFHNSHNGELSALLHFLRHCECRECLLVWVTDSLSGVWSILKGRSVKETSMETIRAIFELADQKRIQIVPLWVPRDLNVFADYLSHLSSTLNRPEVAGIVGDLQRIYQWSGPSPQGQEEHPLEGVHSIPLRDLLSGEVAPSVPTDDTDGAGLCVPLLQRQQGLGEVSAGRHVGFAHADGSTVSRLADPNRGDRSRGWDQGAGVPRHDAGSSGSSPYQEAHRAHAVVSTTGEPARRSVRRFKRGMPSSSFAEWRIAQRPSRQAPPTGLDSR